MRVSPSCVHDEGTRIFSDSFGEALWTFLEDDVAPANFTWHRCIKGRAIWIFAVLEGRYDDFGLETWFADLSFDGASVDRKVSEVGEELLGTILTDNKFEKIGRVVDEGCPCLSADEHIMR
jgi:hypothetical protein